MTRESQNEISNCLLSLKKQLSPVDIQVVVVDNASQDNGVELIRSEFPNVQIVLNDKNEGFSRAANQGLKLLHSKYYLLLNPDSIILDHALDHLVQFMNENPSAGICIPKVLNRDGTIQYQCRRGEARPWDVFSYFVGLSRLFPNDTRFTRYLLEHLDNEKINEVPAVSGSCMMIRREVIKQIGYLDERFFAYQEDSDYCLHARNAGWKVFYVPTASIIHYGGRGGSNVSPYLGIYHWHLSYFFYYRKNLARDYPFWFHPIYYFAMLCKFLLAMVFAFFSADKVVGTRKP